MTADEEPTVVIDRDTRARAFAGLVIGIGLAIFLGQLAYLAGWF